MDITKTLELGKCSYCTGMTTWCVRTSDTTTKRCCPACYSDIFQGSKLERHEVHQTLKGALRTWEDMMPRGFSKYRAPTTSMKRR